MAVDIFEEELSGRRSSRGVNETTAMRVFKVTTTIKTDDEYVILTDSNVPAIGSAYPEDVLLRVKSINVTSPAREQPMLWQVTVEYSTSIPEDSDEVFDDPVNRPPVLSISQIKSTEPVHVIEDFFSRTANTFQVLQNSAGVSYDPPIEREITDVAIRVTQNFKNFHPSEILGFRGAVNNVEWEGFDRGQCRIVDIAYERTTGNGFTFWHRTVEIHVREKTADYTWDTIYPWQVLRKNEGVQQLDTEGVNYLPILAANGWPTVEPTGLTATGQAQTNAVDPTFERWDVYPQKDFADLDIRLT